MKSGGWRARHEEGGEMRKSSAWRAERFSRHSPGRRLLSALEHGLTSFSKLYRLSKLIYPRLKLSRPTLL